MWPARKKKEGGTKERQTRDGAKKWERTSLQGSREGRRDIKGRRNWSRHREMEIQSVRGGVKKQSDRKGKRMGKLQEAEWVTSRRGTILPCPPWCGLDGSTTCQQRTHTLLGCIYTSKHAHSFHTLLHFLCPSTNICIRIWPRSTHRYLLAAAHLGCVVSIMPRWTRFVWPLSGTTLWIQRASPLKSFRRTVVL